MNKVKVPLQIASLLIGIALGALTLWQQIKPSGELVAEVVQTNARLPIKFLKEAKALPDNTEKALRKDKDLTKLLPEPTRRDEVLALVKDTVDRQSFSLHAFESFRKELTAVTVRNKGERLLREVKLGFRFAPHEPVTVIGADGIPKAHEASRVIALGELPPNGEVQVYAWGSSLSVLFLRGDLTISHGDGIGEIHRLVLVPPFIWSNGGIFFSYRHTAISLLAIVLFAVGVYGMYRYRSGRNSNTPRGTA